MSFPRSRRSHTRLAAVFLLVIVATLLWLVIAGATSSKSLLLSTPLSAMPDLGDYAWNPLGRNQWVGVLVLLLAVEALGWLAWPITATVCRWLPDRGYPLSKTLALVLVAWAVWMAASLHIAPFTVWSLLAALALLACGSWLVLRRTRADLTQFMATHRGLLFAWEALFLVAFAALLLSRLADPDLWNAVHGGEKPMDFGFINSILRSAWMPPPDPFFAGGYINYYYYGQFIVACLIKLVGITPAVGYNIVLPILYGLLVLGVSSLVYNLVIIVQRARGSQNSNRTAFTWSLGGVGLVAVAGNLQGGLQMVSIIAPGLYRPLLDLFHGWGLTTPAMTRVFTGVDYWPVSRITPRTIEEFPYWIFLVGDLHAHLIALPFDVAVLGLALNLFLGAWEHRAPSTKYRVESGLFATRYDAALRVAVTALALGALALTNSWDFLTYSVLIAVLVALAAAYSLRVQARTRRSARALFGAGVGLAVLFMLATLAYAPYFLTFKTFYSEVRPIAESVNGMGRTHLAEWIIIWGLFAFVTASYIFAGLRRYPWAEAWAGLGQMFRGTQLASHRLGIVAGISGAGGRSTETEQHLTPDPTRTALFSPAAGLLVLAGAILVALAWTISGEWLLALLVVLIGMIVALQVGAVRNPGLLFAGVLLASALALTLAVELFYVVDFQQGTEWYRMNTVFKFYMQAWVLFGVGSIIALYALLGQRRLPLRSPARWLWLGALLVLLAASATFVVGGTGSRLDERFPVRPAALTLDGTAFMADNSFVFGPTTNTITVTLAYDQAAYDWLLNNARGLPVIATAPTAPDPEGMFVATYTGFPVVVGSMHQEEQRYPDQVAERRAAMADLFRTPDVARTRSILDKYGVTYIYLGPYERWIAHDAPAGLSKFAAMTGQTIEVAYRNPAVTIYRVIKAGR